MLVIINQNYMKQFNNTREKSLFIKPLGIAKKAYTIPQAQQIILDNEISLSLESSPPIGPFESYSIPESMQKQPYNDNLA